MNIVKLRCNCLSIITLLVSILAKNNSNINQDNIKDYLKSDYMSVSNFIEDNFEEFVSKYNETSLLKWNASYIEAKYPILISNLGQESDGMFLDFDKNNGYAIVGNNYELFDFNVEGISPLAAIQADKYLYNTSAGYFYESNGEIKSINDENNADEEFIYDNIMGQSYNGQEKDKIGCGSIKDTNLYVNDKYGSGWAKYRENSLSMTGYHQGKLSCYDQVMIKDDKASTYSEGNCWFVSAYIVLQYMQATKWKFMPSATNIVDYIPSKDEKNVYSLYYDEFNHNLSNLLTYSNNSMKIYEYLLKKDKFSFPKLYTDVRKYVNDRFKHVNGGSIYDTSGIIEYVAKKYGYNVNGVEHIFWSAYVDKGTSKIDLGMPLLWSTSNDTYGNHTMAVCGYKYYVRTTGWWIFQRTEYKLFYELRDGHEEQPRFYDMSGHFGFSAIISLE